jgi:pimeloyl-ACP methyl ester carboxylesterase
MRWDRVGAGWGPEEGVMRVRAATRFGWTPALAARVAAPTLVMAGEYDRLPERRGVFEQLGSKDKVLLTVSCASHFMQWEMQRAAVHRASREWLTRGSLEGQRRGAAVVDRDGTFRVVSLE